MVCNIINNNTTCDKTDSDGANQMGPHLIWIGAAHEKPPNNRTFSWDPIKEKGE